MRDDFDVLEIAAAWERIIAWATSGQLEAIAEFARRPSIIGPDPEAGRAARGAKGAIDREYAEEETSARLSISRMAASRRIELAAALTKTLTARSVCKRHHAFKHLDLSGKRLAQVSPGVFVWLTATGHRYTVTGPALALPLDEEMAWAAEYESGP